VPKIVARRLDSDIACGTSKRIGVRRSPNGRARPRGEYKLVPSCWPLSEMYSQNVGNRFRQRDHAIGCICLDRAELDFTLRRRHQLTIDRDRAAQEVDPIDSEPARLALTQPEACLGENQRAVVVGLQRMRARAPARP
jgi:hypothetical protein